MNIFRIILIIAIVIGLRVVFPPIVGQTEQQRAPQMREIIYRAALREGISPTLACAIALHESNFNPRARNFEERIYHSVFNRGDDAQRRINSSAYGLLQVVYGFHKRNCKLNSAEELYDPDINLACGLSYLRKCVIRSNGEKNPDRKLVLIGNCYNGNGVKYAAALRSAMLQCSVG